mgnify:CR=1 FL=1
MTQSSKIAIVTGAGSGIGKATALALLNAGWSVVLAGRRAANLEEVAAEAKAINPNFNVLAVPTDSSYALACHIDDKAAAAQGLQRLKDFQQAVENSFCCGASVDLLLLGGYDIYDGCIQHRS